MPSNYVAFDVLIENNGQAVPAAGATVKVWNVTADADLGVTLTADSSGIVAAGTLNVPAGTLVRFRVEDFHGRAGFAEQTTI
ncbi:MAG TPA: hypothetical protein VNQ79_15950 [Blastocatellia bacterium]|nr:hypothetical protein [Blastocatellia bacterium]